MVTILGFEIAASVLVLGLVTGVTYGLIAIGLVLIYRANRIVNFAHGAIGGLGAALLGLMVIQWRIPYWIAFVVAIACSAGAGAGVEVAVIRRLRNAPRLMSIVATFGFAQFFFVFMLAIFSQIQTGVLFPKPAGLPEFRVGALLFTQAHFAIVVLSPVVIALLVLFLRYSHFGIGIRAAAANPEAARMAAISPTRMSSLAWAIAGGLAGFTAILIMPTRGIFPVQHLGPGLLLRALAAAVVARMTSLPVALFAGVGIGVIESEFFFNFRRGGVVSALLFGIVMAALLLQTRRGSREQERGSWAAIQAWRPLPEGLLGVWSIRHLSRIVAVVAGVAALTLPLMATNETTIVFVRIMSFALVGLSITLITGLAGELSLGQFAVAGIGATVSYYATAQTGSFVLGFALAAVAGACVSALIAIPALRIRGLMLSVTTLAFALMAFDWLLQQHWMLGDPVDPGRPIVGGQVLDTSRKYYLFALVVFAIGILLARNLRNSGFGRSLVALRDNEDAARAFTVAAVRQRLLAFAFGGVLAGLGGALFGHSLARMSFNNFAPETSLDVAAMSVLGGLGILAGPLLGALYIIGVPAFVPLDAAGLAGTAFGWLILILYVPGGIAHLVRPLRDKVVEFLASRQGIDARTMLRGEEDLSLSAVEVGGLELGLTDRRAKRAKTASSVVLQAKALRKSFGRVTAVENASLEVFKGETLGLIGPNGAGKTTFFDLISGFVRPDEGWVVLEGLDITGLSPEARGRLGLIRSFQEGALFETLTVLDTVRVARERLEPTHLGAAVLGLRRAERRKDERARELVHIMGLDAYRHKQIRELSTGTRRITELASLLALEPSLLLLDEPSSGIAQRETEVLGELLIKVKEELGSTLVVIEHDMPLIMGISDRIIAMAEGRVIADGVPSSVQRNEVVVAAYLGHDSLAIDRSGDGRAATTPRKRESGPQVRRVRIGR